jgi:molybdopterin-guanine dinucleotide biosynthesis protein A
LKKESPVTAIILSGGKSSRLGQDKAFVKIEGIFLIKRQMNLLKQIFPKIIIVTNHPRKYRFREVKIVKDVVLHRGPLAGIYSGLLASDSFFNFVFACDLPFLHPGLIKYMLSLKNGFDIVVPRLKRGYESLFAIYSRNCLKPIARVLKTDDFRVRRIFPQVKLKELSEARIKKFGQPERLFANINTPSDLCRISTSLREQKF